MPKRPSISHACAVKLSARTISPSATLGSPGTTTRMTSAAPPQSATSSTRQRTSPFSSVRGAHASRGLVLLEPLHHLRRAHNDQLQPARLDRKTHLDLPRELIRIHS